MNKRISSDQAVNRPYDYGTKRLRGYLLVILSLITALAGGIFITLSSLAMADPSPPPPDSGGLRGVGRAEPQARPGRGEAKTLDRDLEPVIVTGAAIGAFAGTPTDRIFVYAHQNSAWIQIPAQVDEVTATGAYTDTEDGLLDADDEIVFMAKDLGDQAPADPRSASGFPDVIVWYEIEVTDPISPTHKGWAYLIRSATVTPTFTADYVNFDTGRHRIVGQTYELGFATPRPWIDYLELNNSDVDILDRTPKSRLCYGSFCPFTENLGANLQDDLIKDGPVRLIVRGGRVLAHGAMAAWTVDVPTTLRANNLRFSTDFSPAASGSIFYSAVVPDGVTVDGITDTVPAEPLSPWWQLSTEHGTVIQVSDTRAMGGTQTNYYVDNSEWDSSDTGDHLHYGDTGISVADPNRSFTYTFNVYFLPGSQPNVGEQYAAYFSQPLAAEAELQHLDLPMKVYLPLVSK